MSYKMRFRVELRLIQPQNAPADAAAANPVVFNVGDVTTIPNSDGTFSDTPTGPIITSLTAAVSAIMGVNSRVQRGLKTNVRFAVYGKPVGTAETGAEDIPAEFQLERLYITGDTPNPLLLFYIARANKKPVVASVGAQFVPVDAVPETYVGYNGSAETPPP